MSGYVNCHRHFNSSCHFKNNRNVKGGCACKVKNSVKGGCAGKVKNSVKSGCACKVKNRSLFDENGFFKFSRRYAACEKDGGCRLPLRLLLQL